MFINKEGKIEIFFNSTLKKKTNNTTYRDFWNILLYKVNMDFPSMRCSKCGKTLCYCSCPQKCSKCGQPTYYCKCYSIHKQKEEHNFDISFQAYPCEMKFDPIPSRCPREERKFEPILAGMKEEGSSDAETTIVSQSSSVSHPDELFDCINDTISLTELYFDNKGKEKEEELNKKINKYRCFYLVNDKCWTISLKNKDLYKRYKDDGQFIGNKFKEVLKEEEEMALMVQVVNERFELKSIGKYLFYREVYLHTFKNSSIKKLFKTYVGECEEQFLFDERENVRFYRWKFNVHKNRLVYVVGLLKTNFNVNNECIKTIKSYDDVLKYYLNH